MQASGCRVGLQDRGSGQIQGMHSQRAGPILCKVEGGAVVSTHPSSLLLLALPGLPHVHVRWQFGSAPVAACQLPESMCGGAGKFAVLTEDGRVWLCSSGNAQLPASKKAKAKNHNGDVSVTLDSDRRILPECEIGRASEVCSTRTGSPRALLQDRAGWLVAVGDLPLSGLGVDILEAGADGLAVRRSFDVSFGEDAYPEHPAGIVIVTGSHVGVPSFALCVLFRCPIREFIWHCILFARHSLRFAVSVMPTVFSTPVRTIVMILMQHAISC